MAAYFAWKLQWQARVSRVGEAVCARFTGFYDDRRFHVGVAPTLRTDVPPVNCRPISDHMPARPCVRGGRIRAKFGVVGYALVALIVH